MCVRDLPHGEDALEAAYYEMLDRQGLRLVDRERLGKSQMEPPAQRVQTMLPIWPTLLRYTQVTSLPEHVSRNDAEL